MSLPADKASSGSKSAPTIPNLLDTLRASRPPRNVLSRPREPTSKDAQDAVIQKTDHDAAVSRLSAVELGYLDDPYARLFSEDVEFIRRMPIINRGTYVRTTSIDKLVDKFLAAHRDRRKQIVSLGAGTDTRYFRLLHRDASVRDSLSYHEIDFPATTTKKIQAIQRDADLRTLLGSPASPDPASLTTPAYSIHALDLRDLLSPAPPSLPNLSPTDPTLIISELCLTYLDPALSTAVLTHLTTTLLPPPARLDIVLYEPLHPDDAFGRTMTSNLAARGLALPGMAALPTLAAHGARLAAAGFTGGQDGAETRAVWEGWVGPAEKARLRALELVDEEEEWLLLAGHYGVVWAWREAGG